MYRNFQFYTFLIISSLLLSFCVSSGENTIEGKGEIDKFEIRGFKQFPIYTSRNLLGYIQAEGVEKTFDRQVWRGKVKEDAIKQNISISYTIEDLKSFSGGFKEILSGEVSYENVESVNLILENPVQYVLEEISIHPDFKDKKELFSKQYIGAVLKVDRIKIEFQNKKGLLLKTEADLKVNSIKLGTNIKTNTKENSVFFAENAYIGFKNFDAPENPEKYITEDDLKMKVVVLPFELEGVKPREERLKSALAEATSRALNKVDNIYVLDRNSYQKILEEQQLSKNENFDPKNAVRIGKLMSANTILVGKFSREGLDARITSTMIDVETNSILAIGQIKFDIQLKGKNTPAIADEWEDKILESFGLPISKQRISVLGTNESDAFDSFRKGREKFILLEEESLEEAIPDLIKATELDPNYGDAFSLLSEAYQRLFEYKNFKGDRFTAGKMKINALEAAMKSIEINPNSSSANRVLSFYYYYLEPEFEKSKSYAKKAVELDPKDAEAAMRLFIVNSRQNKKMLSSTNKELLSIYDLNPNLISTNFYLAYAYKQENNFLKAIEFYKKILIISPKNIAIFGEISNLFVENEKWKEAISYLDKIDEIYPNHFQIQIYYANLYIKKRDYKKALEYISIAKKLQPKSTIPYELHANLLIKEKNYDEAISNYQKCFELEPKKVIYLNNIGTLYKYKNDFNQAIQFYKQAVKIDSKFISSYENLGNIYLQQNKIEDSILNFEKCLELDNSSYYLRVLADVQVLKPEIDIAIKNYYKALEMDTEEYMIYNEIGFAQIAKKDFKAANEMFAKAIEKGDDNVKSYSYKGIGDIFRKEKSYDKSIENYKKAIELDKTNFDASIDMANSYSKKNNFQEAIIILKSVLEKDVKNGKAYFFLGKYYRDSGRNDESKESLKKSCELSYQKACDEINGIKKKKK